MSAAAQTRIGWASVTPALLWTLVFFVVPFAAMGVASLFPEGASGLSLANYTQFFANPSYWLALVNSLEVTTLVTIISILLAYPFAWILAFVVPERWQRLALMLAVLPFWTSYVVRSYSWLLVLAEKGAFNSALLQSGLLSDPVQLANTRAATIIGFVHFFVMLLTLTIYANLVQIKESYRKAAADLGASSVQTFLHVTLPLSLPGVAVGAFTTLVLAIGDYITPQILGGGRELLLPQAIMLQIERRADFPMAAALSMILMLVVSAAYLLFARHLRMERV